MENLSISKFSFKKIITSSLILMFILISGINTQNNISAQMPPMGGMMGGGMGTMGSSATDSSCRQNPGTGEVFCEVEMDVSMMTMKSGVEQAVKRAVPEVKEVIDITSL